MDKNNFLINYQKEKKSFQLYFLVIFLVASFGLGMFFGKRKGNNHTEVLGLGLITNKEKEDVFNDQDLQKINETWFEVKKNFSGDLPEKEKIVEETLRGMVHSVGDPYTVYLSQEEIEEFKEDMEGVFEGIGAEIGLRDEILTVISPLDGMPAEKAGIKAGDRIIKINDEITTGMTIQEAVKKIRGPKGTKVNLNIFREDRSEEPLDIEVTRDKVDIKSVKWELKEDRFAYLRVSGFLKDTESEFANVAESIVKEEKVKGIVLDLRNNSGGYLDSAVDLAGYFLSQGDLVVIEDYGEENQKKDKKDYAHGNSELKKYPLVVLINEGSASAAEILAGALKDNRNIKLIGKKTFGKGSVQEIKGLRGGAALKVTVAKWLTPKGVNINKEGIVPDIEQKLREDSEKNDELKVLQKEVEEEQKEDLQLKRALEELKEEVK